MERLLIEIGFANYRFKNISGIFSMCAPQLSGCIFLPPPPPPKRTCHVLHNELICKLICNDTCSVAGGGGGQKRKRSAFPLVPPNVMHPTLQSTCHYAVNFNVSLGVV